MRVIVAGGRNLTAEGAKYLVEKLKQLGAEEIVQSNTEIDSCVEYIAYLIGMRYTRFPAAGAVHSKEPYHEDVWQYADVLINFKGGDNVRMLRDMMREKRVVSVYHPGYTTRSYHKTILNIKGKDLCL